MAPPPPERELSRLRTTLEQGLPPVLLVCGPSRFFRTEAFELALAAVPASAELRVLDGEGDSDGSELADLRGGSLFARGAWLAVRRADGWLKAHGAALEPLLERIAAGCGLLLEAVKVDRRTRLGKLLAAQACFELRDLYAEPFDRTRSPLEGELVGWVQTRGRAVGVKLTPEAALAIVGTVGKEPGELLSALQRLAEQAGGGAVLRPEDLRGFLPVGFESTPFELAEALLAHDRVRCERSLDAMYDRGVRGRDGEQRTDAGGVFPFLVSWLHRALAEAQDGRRLLDGGVPLHDVPGRVGVRTFVERFQEQVEKNPQARLRRGLALLGDCERELRLTGEEPQWLLRRFLARYFAPLQESAS
jgi:DNA polymerase III delta subunit